MFSIGKLFNTSLVRTIPTFVHLNKTPAIKCGTPLSYPSPAIRCGTSFPLSYPSGGCSKHGLDRHVIFRHTSRHTSVLSHWEVPRRVNIFNFTRWYKTQPVGKNRPSKKLVYELQLELLQNGDIVIHGLWAAIRENNGRIRFLFNRHPTLSEINLAREALSKVDEEFRMMMEVMWRSRVGEDSKGFWIHEFTVHSSVVRGDYDTQYYVDVVTVALPYFSGDKKLAEFLKKYGCEVSCDGKDFAMRLGHYLGSKVKIIRNLENPRYFDGVGILLDYDKRTVIDHPEEDDKTDLDLIVRAEGMNFDNPINPLVREIIEHHAMRAHLWDLLVNTLSRNEDIFLKAIVSDALDKLRFLIVTELPLLEDGETEIPIKTRPDNGTITITDTGIGMTKDELVDCLETSAQNGTSKSLSALKVRYLVEPTDKLAIQNLQMNKEQKLVDISKDDLELGDEDEVEERETKQEHNVLCDWIKQQLGDKVAKVKVSNRLSSSPCVLGLMRAQTLGDSSSLEFTRGRRILEVNPDHPIIKELNAACKDSPDSTEAIRAVDLLCDAALISSGFSPHIPAELGNKIYEIMAIALGGRLGRLEDGVTEEASENNSTKSDASDASDALDKLRFLRVTELPLLEDGETEIPIKTRPDNGTITITDTGIGMTKDELVDCLETSAQNGTSKSLSALKVRYLVEPIDELAIQNLQMYKEQKFVDINKDDLELGDEDKVNERETKQEHNVLCDWIKQLLGDKVAKVEVSNRLSSSPCVLGLVRAQTLGDSSSLEFTRGRRILEVNPDHPIIKELNAARKNSADSTEAIRAVDLLYDAALISSGFSPHIPAELENKIYEIIAIALGGRWGK